MIRRQTRGGRLTLAGHAPEPRCASCGAEGVDDTAPIGLAVTAAGGSADGATFSTSICADCLSEALAILFGRRHVQRGGSVVDLAETSPPARADASAGPDDDVDSLGPLGRRPSL